MSLIPGRGSADAAVDERNTAAFLLRRCGLSEDDLRRIRTVMEQLELRFPEAALRLGLATQADLDAASHAEPAAVAPPRARPARELTIAADPFDRHSERIRALRTALLLRQGGEAGSVLAVMSPCSGEGRSRLAAELAIALSQLGRPTLLVDADLRRPRQHALFGLETGAGLAEVLGQRAAPEVQAVAGLPQLFLLTAGMRVSNPLELLSEPQLSDLLAGWSRRYLHIVLDTPPADEVSDALAVATQARRVLVVLRAGRTPLAQSREMLRRLAATPAAVLGAVLNRF